MDLEIAIVAAKDGNAAALVDAMTNGGGCAALEACAGCRSAKALPGVENPENVLILVEWDSVEAHAAAKESEHFKRFHQIAGPFFGGGGSMQHFHAA
jgi:heme-degrading monooxygenase HmoA